MKNNKNIHIKIGNITLGNDLPFVLIAGPDSLESYERTNSIVSKINKYTKELGIPWIMKACFDKSQRTSIDGWRGLGLDKALPVYRRLKKEYGVPITSDFSTTEEAKKMSKVVDLLQVQARLYRQTDILVAAGRYGKSVNLKRSHGESPKGLPGAIGKITSTGNKNIVITERGSVFGHDDIVVDMRLLEAHKNLGYPICLDVSHTCQKPSADNGVSGGERKFSLPLAKAGVAVGVAAIFMEVYDKPELAPVDGPHSFLLSELFEALKLLKKIDQTVKGY